MPQKKEELQEKYQRAVEVVEKNDIASIKLHQAGDIKYRLTLRKTKKGIIHTLEIMEADSAIPAVRIDLFGSWEEVLKSADRVLSELNMDDFRKVADMIKNLRTDRRRRSVEEL